LYKVDKSDIHGYGIIATDDIPKDTIVGKSHMGMGILNGLIVCSDTTVIGSFENHSYNPTCVSIIKEGDIYMVTVKDVKKGEELTVDFTKHSDISINIEYEVGDDWI